MAKANSKAMVKKQTADMTQWEDIFKEDAKRAADQEKNVGLSQMFGTANAKLTRNGQEIPNNEMAVIIVGSLIENALYEGPYDPKNPRSPSCYAFGTDEDTIAPHEAVENPQADTCAVCPMNVYGSAQTGNGKACKNGRRLYLVSAGNFNEDGELELAETSEIEAGDIGILKIPPTALKDYAQYIKSLKGTMGRPPWAVITRVWIAPDPNKQIAYGFEHITTIDEQEMLQAARKLYLAQLEEAHPPYPKNQEGEKQQARGGRGGGRGAPAQRVERKPAPAQQQRRRVPQEEQASEAPAQTSTRRRVVASSSTDAEGDEQPVRRRAGGAPAAETASPRRRVSGSAANAKF